MKCPNCGTENPSTARYCENCKQPLVPEETFWTYKDKNRIISRTITSEKLYELYKEGVINKNTLVKEEGTSEWIPFSDTDMYLNDYLEKPEKKKISIVWFFVVIAALLLGGFGYLYKRSQPEIKTAPVENYTMEQAKNSLASNGWTITDTKVDNFEETPIPVYDIGWLVKVNGKYGLIAVDGSYYIEPKYEKLVIDGSVEGHTTLYESAEDKKGVSLEYAMQLKTDSTPPEKLKFPNATINQFKNVNTGKASKSDFQMPITIYYHDFWDSLLNGGPKYYIWNPVNDGAFGPYSVKESAMFNGDGQITETSESVPGLFYVEHNGKYFVYTDGGTKKTYQSFDWVEPISDSYFLVKKDDEYATINRFLRATFIGKVQDASAPLCGADYVKIEDKWYRITNASYQGLPDLGPLKERFAVEEQANGESAPEEETIEAPKGDKYVLNSNMYVRDAPGGNIMAVYQAATEITVVETETVDNGAVYGILEDGNYVCLSAGGKEYATLVESEDKEDSNSNKKAQNDEDTGENDSSE